MPGRRARPKPPVVHNSLVGASVRLSGPGADTTLPKRWSGQNDAEGWMNEAWRFYDTVGELRFASNWIANALSRVRLYAAEVQGLGQEPAPIDSGPAVDALAMLAGGPEGQAEMLRRLGVILTVPGAGYVLGEPGKNSADLREADWLVTSGNELKRNPTGGFTLDTGIKKRDLHPDTIIARVWRSHPRRWWEADSPTRGALPVLAELEMLTQHVLASAQSRLAGAGVLILPQELSFPAPGPDTDPEAAANDPFLVDLTETMITAIQDRTSPAAVVPITLRVPGEFIDKIKHLTFDFPLDAQAQSLRDEAIRRFAAAMDMPSEIVLGLGDVNHWSAWQLGEQAITIHVVPLGSLICSALTDHYLVPVLEAMGEDPEGQMIWFDSAALTARPNQADDAKDLYDRDGLGMEALRRASGFAEDDKPSDEEWERTLLTKLVLAAPAMAPQILPKLGIKLPEAPTPPPVPVAAVEAVPANEVAKGAEPKQLPKGAPATRELAPPTNQESAVKAALLAACDGVMVRAMERAGARLRTIRSRTPDGRAVVASLAPTSSAEVHAALGPISHQEMGDLLAGAWDRVPEVVARYVADDDLGTIIATHLDSLARSLLSSGKPYTYALLERALRA